MKAKPIYLVGAGGLGREIASMLKAMPEWQLLGFYDDGVAKGTEIAGAPVQGNCLELAASTHAMNVVIAVGDPVTKEELHSVLANNPNITFPSLVHSRAILQDPESIIINDGAIITAGCTLTTNIEVGSHVLINLHCTIGHDCRIGNWSSLMPGVNIAGAVEIGSAVLIGSGAQVLNRIKVGDNARIGSGAVVTRDVREGTTVVGVPAKEVT